MKYSFQQIQIKTKDRYKIAFTVSFGKYEWKVIPFGLRNAPLEFQKIMNDIYTLFTKFIVVHIDDVLIVSKNIDQNLNIITFFLKLPKEMVLLFFKRKFL